MNYTLNQLQIFLKVVELSSITKASQELHLTQPAVSIQLKKFQEQFDFPLTETIGRKLYITDFGHEIGDSASQILNQVNAINNKSLSNKDQLSGKIKISIVSTGKYIMPFFLSDFLIQNENIELKMDVTNKSKVLESLENNEVDFALVSILPSNLKIEKLDLIPNKLYLIGNKNNEFITKKNTLKIFKKLSIVFREVGSGTRQIMEQFFQKNKIEVQKNIVLTSNEAVKQAVIAGLGYSIMPIIGIKNELKNKELNIIPLKGLPISTMWSIIWLKGKKLSPVSTAYLNFLKNEKEQIINKKFIWNEEY